MLVGATAIGRDLGPTVSARVKTGLTADCTSLEIGDFPLVAAPGKESEQKHNQLLMTRPAFGGNTIATIACPVKSAADMFEAVTKLAPEQDIIVKAAAVADYTPVAVADNKIKKSDDDMKIELKRTKDILGYLGQHKRDGQVICGFSMETQDVIKNSEKKLTNKNCDMICANSLKTAGAGFKTDTNVITLITEGGAVELPIMTKEQAAHRILDELAKMI